MPVLFYQINLVIWVSVLDCGGIECTFRSTLGLYRYSTVQCNSALLVAPPTTARCSASVQDIVHKNRGFVDAGMSINAD